VAVQKALELGELESASALATISNYSTDYWEQQDRCFCKCVAREEEDKEDGHEAGEGPGWGFF
jgi:hypothetical protein